jgi:hypothetical protein
MPAPYTDFLGSSYLVWMSGADLPFTPPVRGSTASFRCLEGDPRLTLGMCTSRFQGPPQAAEPESGNCYQTGLSDLISLGPPERLQEECRTSENKTQTQVVGGKEDLLH